MGRDGSSLERVPCAPTDGPRNRDHRTLQSTQSNRDEYWRVAYQTWQEVPVVGAGAGSFPVAWYRSAVPRRPSPIPRLALKLSSNSGWWE